MSHTLQLLINPSAGSVQDTKLLSSTLRQSAGDLDVDVRVLDADPEAGIRDAINANSDFLVVAGGDGTARSVANQLIRSGSQSCLVALPLGTANLLPKRLYGDRDAKTILSELRDYRQVRLHAGVCGDHHFLIAAGIGFVSHFARAREHLREYEKRGAIKKLMIETRQGMAALMAKRLRLSMPDQNQVFKASAAMISPGGLGPAFSGQIEPEAPARLECASLGPRHIGELATLGVLAGLDRWRDHRSIRTCWSDTFHIEASRPIEVMLDGEPIQLEGPLDISLKPSCLTVAVAEAA